MAPQNLVDRRLFALILNLEIQKATRLQYPLSVLCLAAGLPRREATPAWIDRLAGLSVSQVRATDLATRLDGSAVALLLIDAETRSLPGIFHRLKDGLMIIPQLTVSGGGACYPQTATSGREMLEQAVELMTRAKGTGGNRLYLQEELTSSLR